MDLLNRALSAALDSFRTPTYIWAHRHDRLRSAEEAFYHRLLADTFAGSRVVLDNVGHWAEREPAPGEASQLQARIRRSVGALARGRPLILHDTAVLRMDITLGTDLLAM